MPVITRKLLRKRSEHNEGIISTMEELTLHQEELEGINEVLGLTCKKIKILYLQNNIIPKIENLTHLKDLEYLNLALNNISKIEGLQNCEFLSKLDLTVNFIDCDELESSMNHMQPLEYLKELYMMGNPSQSDWAGFNHYVIAKLPQLKYLDGTEITKSMRIMATQRLPELEKELASLATAVKLKKIEKSMSKLVEKKDGVIDLKDHKDGDVIEVEDVDSDEEEQRKANELTEHTPETRNEIYRELAKDKKEKEDRENQNKPKERDYEKEQLEAVETLRQKEKEAEKEIRQKNEGGWEFKWDEESTPGFVILEVIIAKYLDSSLIDVDINPTYVSIIIKITMKKLNAKENAVTIRGNVKAKAAADTVRETAAATKKPPKKLSIQEQMLLDAQALSDASLTKVETSIFHIVKQSSPEDNTPGHEAVTEEKVNSVASASASRREMPTSFSLLRGSDMPSRRANRVKGRAKAALENISKDSSEYIDEEYQTILENMLSEDYLRDVSGVNNLNEVSHLEIVVDTTLQSLLDLNEKLPNLKSLVLDNSVITTIRDLGVGLRSLTVLSINNCDLYDIDGIGVLINLQELNICDNNITDITPLAMHDCLQVLNLSGNNLRTFSFADTLSSCIKIRSLFLSRNPIESAPNYRAVISSLISTLHLLDGQPVDFEARSKVTNAMIIESVTVMLKIDEEMGEKAYVSNSKSSTDLSQPLHHKERDQLRSNNDTGSDLTHGNAIVLAGNAAVAMRRRRSNHVQPGAECTALDALDKAQFSGEQSNPKPIPFSGEGDVTLLHDGNDMAYDPMDRSSSVSTRQTRFDNSSTVKSWSSFSSGMKEMGLTGSNKQRPQSAIVTSRSKAPLISPHDVSTKRCSDDSNILKNAPSAPFKVLADTESQSLLLRDRENKKFCNLEDVRNENSVYTKLAKDKSVSTANKEPSSIVHRDIVRRVSRAVDSDSDSDDEDIAITHDARHSLMSRSSRSRGGVTVTGTKGVLSPGTILGENRASKQEERSSDLLNTDQHVYSLDNNNYFDTVSTALLTKQTAKAGALLGFNLAGSLAAIDQWVDDMDSHSDESSDHHDDGMAPKDKTKKSRVFKNQAWSSTGMFLTRENIINMCTGNEVQSSPADTAVQEKVNPPLKITEKNLKYCNALEAPQGVRRKL